MTVQGCVIADSKDLAGSRSRQERHITLKHDRTAVGQHNSSPEHTPRLRLKPKASQCGYVDGAWWPRSDNLATELPDLLAVLSVRLGPVERVIFNSNEWAKPPAKFATGGRRVRLDAYRLQPTSTVEVLGLDRNKMVLLVVPTNTQPDTAHATLMAAAAPSNDSTVDSLLMVSARERESRTQAAGTQQRWESAGQQSANSAGI
ncbi:MAG: DUF5994 family protein [Mycobacterium sp.]